MNCSTTYEHVPPELSAELIQTVWGKGGYVLASAERLVMLADEKVFYEIDTLCRGMLRQHEASNPAHESTSVPTPESVESDSGSNIAPDSGVG